MRCNIADRPKLVTSKERKLADWRGIRRRLAGGILTATLLLGGTMGAAEPRSALAPAPDWASLEKYQETITGEDFTRLLNEVYAPRKAASEWVQLMPEAAVITLSKNPPVTWTLRFAKSAEQAKPVPRHWRPAAELPPAPPSRPLEGMKIAIDPGHLGGPWARMEERWFQIGESKPVMEGEMTLRVAELLAPKLTALGANVTLVRTKTEPVTPERPESLKDAALGEFARTNSKPTRDSYNGPDDPAKGGTLQWQSELLFYRISEIRHRAQIVNEQIQPDLTVCLHFNAEAWGDPKTPSFVPRNHFHAIVNGCYSAAELRNEDVRFEMTNKLLSRSFDEEAKLSTVAAESIAKATALPPYTYTTSNAVSVGSSPYVWARNLLANRVYHSPVLFLEPYVMNSEEVWERVQAGDYEGTRSIAGQNRKSIYREYADAVTAGLRDYFTAARPQAKP